MKKVAIKTTPGMITVTCPKCAIPFGLNTPFVEKVGSANFKYNCPYCGYKHSLKD